tara:strand:+ start:2401 stop:2925 length:525 start_codon:yes stop_codon:yes gene_type:complete
MSINNFVFSGNLGKDSEIKTTQAGKSICLFSVASKSGYGDNQKTSWIECKILNDGFANAMQPHLVKGRKVVVSGEFVYEEWEKDGIKNGRPVCLVKDIEISDPAQAMSQQSQQQAPAQNHYQNAPQQQQAPQQQPMSKQANPQQQAPQQQAPAQAPQQQAPAQGFDDFDDDIPF